MHSFNANIVTTLWEEKVQTIRFTVFTFIYMNICVYVCTYIYIYIYGLGYEVNFLDLNTGLP